MDNDYYVPSAFFVFESDLLKYQVRNSMAPVVKDCLKLNNGVSTPWKINIFRIEEFEIVPRADIPAHIEKLVELNGRDIVKSKEIPYISPNDVRLTRHNAQMLLDNPNTRLILDRAKEMNLNYIIQGVYDDATSLLRVKHTNDLKVFNALTEIVAKLYNTKIAWENKNFKNSFYAYTEDDTLKFITRNGMPLP
jgi:hypothetical protein